MGVQEKLPKPLGKEQPFVCPGEGDEYPSQRPDAEVSFLVFVGIGKPFARKKE